MRASGELARKKLLIMLYSIRNILHFGVNR
nr:MAG TPA: GLUCOSE-6-PHOSPHATE 1-DEHYDROGENASE [Caudoviricetes sp.]